MSFTTTIQITKFINRGVEMLLANSLLRDSGTPADSLVTDVLAQEPPIDQSPGDALLPIIYVGYSKNPFNRVENFGRDSLDAAGAKYYHIEFYNVCIDQGIDKEDAAVRVQRLSEIVRDVYQKNLRMTDPAAPTTDPRCATNEVIAVPFVLRSTANNIQAINVICRPKVPIRLV